VSAEPCSYYSAYKVHTTGDLHGCGNGDINTVSGGFLAVARMNSSYSTGRRGDVPARGNTAVWEQCFVGVSAGAIRLLGCPDSGHTQLSLTNRATHLC